MWRIGFQLRVLVATAAIAAFVPVGVGVESACAAESPRAVLVVDAGDDGGVHRYCVALPAQSVSGIRLIQLANEQQGLAYRLGHGGQAVCMLAGVGPAEGDCFGEYPDFWGYWRGDSSGGWKWSNVGAGSTQVGDGDVDGWSWGRGGSPSSHPKPPRTKFSDVCPAVKETGARSAPRAERQESTQPASARAGSASTEDDEGSDGRPKRKQSGDKGKRAGAVPSPRATEEAPAPAAAPSPADASAASDRGSAPTPGGLAALGATVVLAAAGALAARRRKRA